MTSGDVVILKNNVDAIRKAVTGEHLKKAVQAGGHVLEGHAKINIEKTFSGKSTGAAGLGGSVQVVVSKSTATEAEVDVGPTVIYGRIHEFGGIIKPIRAKMLSWIADTGERIFANLVQIPARPYLRPAFDEHKDDIVTAMEHQLKKAIEQAASE